MRNHWSRWQRVWTPHQLDGLIAMSFADDGVTLHDTPRSQGTTPPVLTLSASPGGSLTSTVFPYVQIDGAGTRGTATFKVSYDDGATFPHTGIQTAATNTLPGIGAHITANWAAGTYATNNIYQPLATQLGDLTGNGRNAVQATAAACAIARAVGFNGKPCLDFGSGTTFGYAISNITLGPYTLFAIVRGDASSEYLAVHITDASTNGSYTYCQLANASSIARGSVVSQRRVNATWLADGTRRSVGISFDGTHAGHVIYRNGVAEVPVDGPATSDPGTGTVNGTLHIGRSQAGGNGFRGRIAGWAIFNRSCTATEHSFLHNYATISRGFTL